MSNINRRQFLLSATSALATIGISQLDIMRQGENYAKVLAQNTPRKLALLVGINKYSDNLTELRGCINDVYLQQQLLINRFGFNPQDVLILTDTQATRKGMLEAFEEHLIKQAKPGDVVVFHYSGHGARVSDKPSCDEVALRVSNECANSTFCPIDARSKGAVRDIMGHTLFLLMSALKTENFTAVLDSCHAGGGKRGNFQVRSLGGSDLPSPSQEELEYQQKWLSKLNISSKEFVDRRRKSIAKGVVIAGAKRDQYAVDANFSDFNAGAFTYLFTQYLWQQTGSESLQRIILQVGRNTKSYARNVGNVQEPEFEANLNQKNVNLPIYFTTLSSKSADAVVTKVNGDQVDLWLGGIDSQVLDAFQKDTVFSVLDTSGEERALVKLESRTGLIGRGKLIATQSRATTPQLQPGALLQERIRSIPSDVALNIGLDDTSLDSNYIEQAKQSLQAIKRIQALPLGTSEVQYIFGRMTDSKYKELQTNKALNLPLAGSLGLFLPSSEQILPGSFGAKDESVSAAVNRLRPKLKSLLAARIVKQMLGNTSTSRLKVIATMTLAAGNKIVGEVFPTRSVSKINSGGNQATQAPSINSEEAKLPLGTEIAFQVRNDEPVSLYISILVIDASGDMVIIFPNDYSASESAAKLDAGQKLLIPQSGIDAFKLTVSEPVGFTEVLIVASTTPLRDSLKALKEIATSRGSRNRSPIAVADDELLNVTNSLLDDLDTGTRGGIAAEGITLAQGVRGVDTKKLAAISITFEVVK